MPHPAEDAMNQSIHTLRGHYEPWRDGASLHLGDGVYLNWDDAGAKVNIKAQQQAQCLIDLDVQIEGDPKWVTLNFELESAPFRTGEELGVVADFDGCSGEQIKAFVRSASNGETEDTHFAGTLSGGNRSAQVLMHKVKADDPIAKGNAFHTLVIELPKSSFMLNLYAVRLFVVLP